jgi:hypothetical protein
MKLVKFEQVVAAPGQAHALRASNMGGLGRFGSLLLGSFLLIDGRRLNLRHCQSGPETARVILLVGALQPLGLPKGERQLLKGRNRGVGCFSGCRRLAKKGRRWEHCWRRSIRPRT